MLIIAAGISSVIGTNSSDVGNIMPNKTPATATDARLNIQPTISEFANEFSASGKANTISEVTGNNTASTDEFPAERPNSSVSKNRTMAVSIDEWFVFVISFCVIGLSLVKNSYRFKTISSYRFR